MRFISLIMLVFLATLSACKARQDAAQLRDTGDVQPSGDLGAQLSDLATGMEADLSTYTAGVFVPRDTAAALDDNKPRARTKDELDALRKAAADAAAEYKLAQAETDKLDAERIAALARLNTKLDATKAALSKIDSADSERYAQGLDDVQKVLDEMKAANKVNTSIKCPTNYVGVPGDKFFGTKDFCLMKYEAKVQGNLAVSAATGVFPAEGKVNFTAAKQLCTAIGTGYALVTNAEWLSLATNIAQTAVNWSGKAVGSGAVNVGNNGVAALAAGPDDKPCTNMAGNCDDKVWVAGRRTHTLSNGQIIWDVSGNLYEFVDYTNASESRIPGSNVDLSTLVSAPGMPLTVVRPTRNTHPFWNDNWGKAQGMGTYLSYTTPSSSPQGVRGGSGSGTFNLENAGIFAMAMYFGPTEEASSAGVRCAFHP